MITNARDKIIVELFRNLHKQSEIADSLNVSRQVVNVIVHRKLDKKEIEKVNFLRSQKLKYDRIERNRKLCRERYRNKLIK